jgi:hypothetical protein
MRLPSLRQTLSCLALLAAFGCASAAEAKHQLPESTNTAIDPPAPPVDRLDDADMDGAIANNHMQRTPKAKPQASVPVRSTGDSRVLPSRFHSFLPGMFR